LNEEGADRAKGEKAKYGMPKNSGEYKPTEPESEKRTPKQRNDGIIRHCSAPGRKKSQFCKDWVVNNCNNPKHKDSKFCKDWIASE
jgi:hypothetical protein